MPFDYHQKFDFDQVYHIYNRSIQNALLFREESDYQNFMAKYKEYLSPYLSTFAYCLIPNHFHFLIKVKSLEEIITFIKNDKTITSVKYLKNEISIDEFLTNQMKRFFSSIAVRHNKKYNRRGNLFEQRFKRVQVNKESKLTYLISYIHHNPIHHGLTNEMSKWKFSSFRAYSYQEDTKLDKKQILKWYGGLNHFLKAHSAFQLDFREDKEILKNINMD